MWYKERTPRVCWLLYTSEQLSLRQWFLLQLWRSRIHCPRDETATCSFSCCGCGSIGWWSHCFPVSDVFILKRYDIFTLDPLGEFKTISEVIGVREAVQSLRCGCSNMRTWVQISSTYVKKKSAYPCNSSSRGVGKQFPGAQWPSSLTKSMSSRLNGRPCLKFSKHMVESRWGEHPTAVFYSSSESMTPNACF